MKSLEGYIYKSGMTVRELKELIKDWPEFNRDEEENEVWIGHGNSLSSVVTHVYPLNLRTLDCGGETSDIILEGGI